MIYHNVTYVNGDLEDNQDGTEHWHVLYYTITYDHHVYVGHFIWQLRVLHRNQCHINVAISALSIHKVSARPQPHARTARALSTYYLFSMPINMPQVHWPNDRCFDRYSPPGMRGPTNTTSGSFGCW
jgi:hypothetical protein